MFICSYISLDMDRPMDQIGQIERRLKLQDMRILMAVVQARSMSKAAQRLRTSQPAISRSISIYEEILGVPLLERLPRGVEPTPYGLAIVGLRGIEWANLSLKVEESCAFPSDFELRLALRFGIRDGWQDEQN